MTPQSLPRLYPPPASLVQGGRLLPIRTATRELVDRGPDRSLPPEGFRLVHATEGTFFTAADPAGARYARSAWRQLCRAEYLPELEIRDWPDFPVRGLMLDISRCKVPTLATLRNLAEVLADLRINQLQLYMEHTFAFPGHDLVWGDASPLDAADIRSLDLCCSEVGIELVPNFNSFGHFERWLRHPEYQHLAESPEGFTLWNGEHRPHGSTLKPEDRSLAFVASLQDALLPHFSSRQFNIGCDETWELGQGWSRELCRKSGKHRIYLDFLKKLHAIAARRGHRVQFWADIILHEPSLIAELPKDLVGLVWGYEATHPFTEQCPRFAEAGIEYLVCPGTSGWNSLGGRTENLLLNQRSAALSASAHGARGMLTTDWGDGGHHHPLTVSVPGIVVGAGHSWRADCDQGAALQEAIGRTLWRLENLAAPEPPICRAAGVRLLDLGRLTDPFGQRLHNSSALHHLLFTQDLGSLAPKLWIERDSVEAARARLQGWMLDLAATELPPLAKQEAAWACEVMDIACLRWLDAHGSPAGTRSNLRSRLTRAIGSFEHIWLSRNRPGGLHESSARLRKLLPAG